MILEGKHFFINFLYTILLILYLILLLQMTLIGRTYTDPLSAVFTGWLPFKRNGVWNIDAIYNIFLLTPIIFLINGIYPFVLQKNWKYKTAILSFIISFFIEINQLIFSIGTFQIADLVYNTLSGVIGGVLFKQIHRSLYIKCLLEKWRMIVKKKWFEKYKKYINRGEINKAKELLLKKIPKDKIVYKYFRDVNRDWNSITKNKVWISNAGNFNDPFDCAFLYNCRSKKCYDSQIERDLAIKERMKQRKQDKVSNNLQASVFISCFSERYDSMLMWSHYGDEHRGICVGYNLYELIKKYNCFPVIYSNKMPQRKKQHINNENMLYESILTKNEGWKYEIEWRIINIDGKSIGNPGYLMEKFVQPVSIYLGARWYDVIQENDDKIDINTIIKYVQEKKISLYSCELSRERFHLKHKLYKI